MSFENLVKEFKGKKILHIGNIANNAYINAKIMRQHGIEADVLSIDYYHIMGTPEWEDVELSSNYTINEFYPKWNKKILGEFKRPDWFFQGRKEWILQQLLHKKNGNKFKYKLYFLFNKLNNYFRDEYTLSFFYNIKKILYLVYSKVKIIKRALIKPFLTFFPSLFSQPKTAFTRVDALSEIVKHYDIVQCYATEGERLLNFGYINFAAYEHGTIRDIPFQNDATGLACRKVYTQAPIVFVTNSDCLVAAKKLNIPGERTFPVPHAFDSDKAERFYTKWVNKIEPFEVPTFLAPARHHWKEGYSTWLKGNDNIIQAAKILKDEGYRFKFIFIDWGKEVKLSKELISRLDLEEYFEWWKPLTKFELWRTYLKVDGIIDQFVLPALGSVGFESLAMGKPLFTRIDENVLNEFFGKVPPLLNVKDYNELSRRLRPALDDRKFYSSLGDQAREWISSYHSSKKILEIHLNAYKKLIISGNAASYEKQSIANQK